MTPIDGKELQKVASKKAMDFIEGFIKRNGSEISNSEAPLFESARPAFESIYAFAYEAGYLDAFERLMKDMP